LTETFHSTFELEFSVVLFKFMSLNWIPRVGCHMDIYNITIYYILTSKGVYTCEFSNLSESKILFVF